jgi:hypothetical protein
MGDDGMMNVEDMSAITFELRELLKQIKELDGKIDTALYGGGANA